MVGDRGEPARLGNTPDLRLIHRVFEHVAKKAADRFAAAQLQQRRVSYAELDALANGVAARLLASGVSVEQCIGLVASSTIESIVGALGILKAGGACVPIAPRWPSPRVRAVVEATDMAAVVIASPASDPVDALPAAMPRLSVGPPMNPPSAAPDQLPDVGPDNLAYVLFTSGTTGVPKAVGITHGAVVNLVTAPVHARLGQWTVTGQLASPSFDASLLEIWGPLLNGGTCVLVGDELPTPRTLRRLIRYNRVNTLLLTNSVFSVCADEDPEAFIGLDWLYVAGEVFSTQHGRRAAAALVDTEVFNGYGPTECTCLSSAQWVAIEELDDQPVPVGTAVQNVAVRIIDEKGGVVPPGVRGEIHISGMGLSRGYLNDVRLTAERFVPDPHGIMGSRMYRTGDLGTMNTEEVVEFFGRYDRQVKIHGNRVECDEVELALRAVPGVASCAVLGQSMTTGLTRLIAYVVPETDTLLNEVMLRVSLAERLPLAAVPVQFCFLTTLPLNSSLKTDYSALAELPIASSGAQE